MSTLRVTDREIELLLSGQSTGSNDLSQLEALAAALAQEATPPHDTAHMATALAATARSSASAPVRRSSRRLVVVGATMVLFLAFSGLALAADKAAPGDILYGLDRALERIGIGAGGTDERLAEFETLLRRGDEAAALSFYEEQIRDAVTNVDDTARDSMVGSGNEGDGLAETGDSVIDPGDGAGETGNSGQESASGNGQENSPPGQDKTPPGQENTPPGQENTPPGQENTPPGQENTPPGQQQTPPGQENTPPGQENTPPGQEQTPPGQEQTPPGQEQTPPGQEKTPPGQEKTPPGQEKTPPGQEKTPPGQEQGQGQG